MSNEFLFWTQIASILGFVGVLFGLYRSLSEQKDATIQLLRETIATMKDQLAEARRTTPDVLAQTLSSRAKLLEAELERLSKDQNTSQEQIRKTEEELLVARQQIEKLATQVETAQELLEDFSCPHCGSPLVTRECFSELVEYKGRELDVDHEYTEFECGYAIRDGKAEGECRNIKPWPKKAT